MTMLCITNDIHDFRSCTIKNEHTVRCDGGEYRWNETHQRMEATGKPCRGCLPKLAQHGCLCWPCWERVQQAFADWTPFEPMIRGVERAVQRDNGGIRGQSIGYVPIPGTVLAVEEIRSYLRSNPGNVDLWISTPEGAADAVRFARAVASAIRTHAVEEKAHKLHRLRCPDCGQLNLLWNPPSHGGGDITVTCQCGKTIREHDTTRDGQEKLAIVADIEKPPTAAATSVGITGGRDEFAEQYDPTRPDHADLDRLSTLTVAQLRAQLPPETDRLNYLRKTELIAAINALETCA